MVKLERGVKFAYIKAYIRASFLGPVRAWLRRDGILAGFFFSQCVPDNQTNTDENQPAKKGLNQHETIKALLGEIYCAPFYLTAGGGPV